MGPEIPRWALMALGFLFGTLALLAMSLLVRDALGLVVLTFSRRAGGFILGNGWLTFALIVTCTGLALAGVREAVSAPRVRQVEVVLPGLAAEFEGYRMVHLGDLQVSRLLTRSWLDEVVRAVNAQRPDAVLISGDLMDGTPEARARDSLVLGDLRARDGLFAVPGNHDYFGDFEEWLSSLRKLGWQIWWRTWGMRWTRCSRPRPQGTWAGVIPI
ncbi:MAG: hypothetical protein CMLOHMNK_03003 [Steroidobacteraceae bacterium]|nr:hypothetical protein [Steroidobacteraceae bacterium]